MKKRVFISLLTTLLLVLVLTVAASAQGPSSYTTGFQVKNLSDTDAANINITYYNPDGTVDTTVPDTIDAGGAADYFPLPTTAGFNGSVVISSDQAVAAIVNVLGDDGAFGGAAYGSFSGGSGTAFVPQVLSDFFGISTFFNVQNTGAANATVSVEYTTNNGTCSEADVVIAPGAAHTFSQDSDDTSLACLAAGSVGSATVSSTDGEVAVAVVTIDADSLLAYNAFSTTGSTTALAPIISQNFFNSRTGLSVQNTTGTNASVTVNYSHSNGFPGADCSESKMVPANGSALFGDSTFFDSTPACDAGSGWVGAAEIVSDQNVVVIINSVTTGTANGAAYSAFDPATGTTTVAFPQIIDNLFGIFTGTSVTNAGSADTTISCAFADSTYTVSGLVAPGQSLTDTQLNKIAPGYLGSATCTSTGEPIVGVLTTLTQGSTADALLYSEAFNN
jgi:hypothetical protein